MGVIFNFNIRTEKDGHTHAWRVYLRPFENEDLSVFVKKVQFKLHNSYAVPIRTVTKPPYEVKESGWGEFDVEIKIYINDSPEKSVILYHPLKLFQEVSEWYDEIVFVNPSPILHGMLSNTRIWKQGHYSHDTDFKTKEKETLKGIRSAQKNLTSAIKESQAELDEKRKQIRILKEFIGNAERR